MRAIRQRLFVRHQHHGRVLFPVQRQDQLQNHRSGRAIEVPRGLIREQYRRPQRESARQCHTLLFAAGELHRVVVESVRKPDAVQQPVTNHAAARGVIDNQQATGGTDTGPALQLALQMLHGQQKYHAPAAIVLLSDGAANLGVDPVTVASEANANGVVMAGRTEKYRSSS